MGRHPDAQPIPGLVILRLDAPLYFFNANVARTQILAQTAVDLPPLAILLDLGATADLDIGTSDMLRDLTAIAPGQYRSALCAGARLGAAAYQQDRAVRPYRRRSHFPER